MANSDTQERNLELARNGLQAWVSGDREATMTLLSDDVEVFVPPELGNAGSYRGRDAFLRWSEQWDEAWSEFEMTVESIEPVGERHVVAVVRSRGRGAASGAEVENLLGWVLGVRDEICDYVSLQPDLERARENARAREPGS